MSMKNFYTFIFTMATMGAIHAQSFYGPAAQQLIYAPIVQLAPYTTNETCNTVVINDTEEQNGAFIIGQSGQKAAVDIPIAANQVITISQLKVTLSSLEEPTFVHLRFYSNILSEPEDEEVQPGFIPGEILFDVEDTEIESFEVIGYEEMHDFYVRNITLTLAEPIVLNGADVDGRYWMGVLSDANAWASTAHYETGDGLVGESYAMGANTFEWFQMLNLELLYEITAECTTTAGTDDFTENTVALYPNPAHTTFNIATTTGIEFTKAELFTITGQKVKEITGNSVTTISIADLASGMYVVKTTDANGTIYNNRLIKN
jgi:hypothetical protein